MQGAHGATPASEIMTDDNTRYNRERWRRLAEADALFTRARTP
jgi:hypothetical protein